MATQVNLQAKEASIEAQITALKDDSTLTLQERTDLATLESDLNNLISALSGLTKSLATNSDYQTLISNNLSKLNSDLAQAAQVFGSDHISENQAIFQNLTSNVDQNVLGFHIDGEKFSFGDSFTDPHNSLQNYLVNFAGNDEFFTKFIINPLTTMEDNIPPIIK